MTSEDVRVGAAGLVLAANIKRARTGRRWSFAELSRLLADAGRPIPELGLRRIELGERRCDYDDLLAIAYVLEICVVDLMVSKDADAEPYPITATRAFTAESVRDWISGQDIRLQPVMDHSVFASPGTWMWPALEQMPAERRRAVMRKHSSEVEES